MEIGNWKFATKCTDTMCVNIDFHDGIVPRSFNICWKCGGNTKSTTARKCWEHWWQKMFWGKYVAEEHKHGL